jgi:AbrB family looped-hinge helix DNA binding protein
MNRIEIVTVSKKGQMVLPKAVRKQIGIKQGSRLLLIQKNNQLTLKKIDSQLEEKLFTAFASEKILAKDWLSKEEEKAWKTL